MLWDLLSGNLLHTLNGHAFGIKLLTFSPDGRCLASGSLSGAIKLWDVSSGNLLHTLNGHSFPINSISFSPDGKYLASGSHDHTIKLWDITNGEEIATLINVDSTDWIVTTPSGLFDASPGAMELMHYTVGLEVIELNQLKDRYYEPGLLPKLLGYSDEPIRDVTAFDSVALYPEIALSSVQDDQLHISLKNQGGGIGKVQIFINDKEITADARGEEVNPQADSVSISYSIADHPFLQPGNNTIEVKAYNAEGWLVSRGVELVYQSEQEERDPPRLFLLSIGVSDYTGEQIDLKYAAKDAEDMAAALQLGAHRLFGTEKTYTHLLTSEQNDHLPTKENILATFDAIAKEAKSTDVFVAYLSGHGINWGGQDGDFYYLTQDAYTASTDAYNDPAIRESTTLSSTQLTELINTIPAQKQVLIIDACASGRVVENLMAQRDIPSSTIRALERMKDRTGMHIITGCAADAVSYEASRYGQGVLTYSLLEGIKGAALKEEKFVDVNTLFQYARERVPALAEGVGGIKEPEVFSPYGAESFDIGEFTETDKGQIPLSSAKPLFLRAAFFEQTSFDDVLGLENTVNEAFRELSTRGREAPLVFVEVDEFPEAFRIRGMYTLEDKRVQLEANVFKGKELLGTFELSGNSTDLPTFAEQLIRQARAVDKRNECY